MIGHSLELSKGRSLSKPQKGLYIPNANINMVEKNPMNITIYNIRNSSQGAVTKGDSVNHKLNSKGHHRQ